MAASSLRWTEHCWCEVLFLGRPARPHPQFEDEPEDGDWRVAGIPLAQLLDEYEAQCAVSNEIVAGSDLDAVGSHPDFGSATGTLRGILLHMPEETGRQKGYY